MLNKKIQTLLAMTLISIATLAQANDHPADSTSILKTASLGDCCYRQRVKVAYTQGNCPKGSYVIYAKAKNRDFSAPAGYLDVQKVAVNHVPFGLVLGADGKKFKTRSGDTERLIDLLTTAIAEAKRILAEREVNMNEQQLAETAKVLGINAIKYADLASNRTSDYVFSYDRMLRFEGNTAAFLMYSYVRINGIKRKVGVDVDNINAVLELNHPSELALAIHLDQFAVTLEQMTKDLAPHRLTEYLYNLAERFNAFFRDCRVEGDPAQNSRLLLCETAAKVMRQGFYILGLKPLERM